MDYKRAVDKATPGVIPSLAAVGLAATLAVIIFGDMTAPHTRELAFVLGVVVTLPTALVSIILLTAVTRTDRSASTDDSQ